MNDASTKQSARLPGLIESALPVIVLAVLMGLVIAAFGDGATGGPAQLALITAGAVSGILAVWRGTDWEMLESSVVSTVSSATIAVAQ